MLRRLDITLALAILQFTGVRRSDAVKLGPQMEHDGWLRWTKAKGRSQFVNQRELPILPALRAVLAATPSGHLAYRVTAFGKPFAANNGVTQRQLMAIYGWESPTQAAHYTRKANRKKLAGDATHLVDPDQTGNKTVAPSDVVREGATISLKKS